MVSHRLFVHEDRDAEESSRERDVQNASPRRRRRVLLSGGADACIVATDVATGSTVARLENAHATSINRIITLSGNVIASGDDDGCVKIWDTGLA